MMKKTDASFARPLNLDRRALLGGLSFSAILALPACQSLGGFGLTDAIQRLLFLSSERAFARLTEPGAFWDQQVARVGLGNLLGTRGDVLSGILTSALFKNRLEDVFAGFALDASDRAAPVVTDAVRVIGIRNAVALVEGGPRAATSYLRGEVGNRLIEAMVPEIADAMRIARDPLVGQLVSAAVGSDVSRLADRLADTVNDTIWGEIGNEEARIRENPRETRDPAIIGVFGARNAL